MTEIIAIGYSFKFGNGTKKAFNIRLDREKLSIIADDLRTPPDWTRLGYNRCSECSLADDVKHCPIAYNLSGITEEFRDCFAYQDVNVSVDTEERIYSKDTNVQEGLGSMIGIIMVTSCCPVMDYLKPMVRFHLPFATLTETIFRITSVYLMAQFFRAQEGRGGSWDIGSIGEIYSKVNNLNRDFFQRLSAAAEKDANVNALVNLDCFAQMIPLTTQETLNEIKKYYTAYFK